MSPGVEIVAETDRLHQISDEWRALAERRSNAFSTPEWFFAWLEVRRERARPLVAVRRGDDGRVAGVMPLVAEGRGRRCAVRFAGARVGDLFLPLDADSETELAVGAVRELRACGERHPMVLDHVESGAAWVRALGDGPLAATPLRHLDAVLPEVAISGVSWDEYLADRSRNLRSQLGRRRRRLEREHEVLFRRTDRDRLEGDMEALRGLHQGRWESRGGSAALDPESIAFHERFAAAILERGWLRLWIVEVDGEPAAAWYGWRIGDRYSYYLAGFDESYADYSLGTLLLAHTVRDAIDEGAGTYEMLRGTEPFKLRFATGERRVSSLMLSGRAHPMRLTAVAERAVRGALDRVGPQARARIKRPLRAIADRVSVSR